MPAKARNYKKEYASYHAQPEQKKRRAQRNAARRKLTKEGRVRKGDRKDVHHVAGNKKGPLSNRRSNLRVMSRSANRAKK